MYIDCAKKVPAKIYAFVENERAESIIAFLEISFDNFSLFETRNMSTGKRAADVTIKSLIDINMSRYDTREILAIRIRESTAYLYVVSYGATFITCPCSIVSLIDP
jgi:hypothetical protein